VSVADELHPVMIRDLSDVFTRLFSITYERQCKLREICNTLGRAAIFKKRPKGTTS